MAAAGGPAATLQPPGGAVGATNTPLAAPPSLAVPQHRGAPGATGLPQHHQAQQHQPCSTSGCSGTLLGTHLDRRDALVLSSSLVLSQLAALAGPTPRAHAATGGGASTSGRGLSAYIKKKQLDPLETYVPLMLEARLVLASSRELATSNAAVARELLRSGPYNGLRDNIRALGEYAARAEGGDAAAATGLVSAFFQALESYDRLLYTAVREQTNPAAGDVDAKVSALDAAFGDLLATVPADVVRRAQDVLDVTQAKAAAVAEGGGGPGAAAAGAVTDEELLQLLR